MLKAVRTDRWPDIGTHSMSLFWRNYLKKKLYDVKQNLFTLFYFKIKQTNYKESGVEGDCKGAGLEVNHSHAAPIKFVFKLLQVQARLQASLKSLFSPRFCLCRLIALSAGSQIF